MVILGIDPGVATIGFGIIRAERRRNGTFRNCAQRYSGGMLTVSADTVRMISAHRKKER